MAGDAYRSSEEATRARIAHLEVELENSQNRVGAARLKIAATELRYPPDPPTGPRQLLVIFAIGVLFFLLLTTRHPAPEDVIVTFVLGLALVPFALPKDIFTARKTRRADRARLEEALRERATLIAEIAQTRGSLPARSADSDHDDEVEPELRRKA